jgi:hypothetical protein
MALSKSKKRFGVSVRLSFQLPTIPDGKVSNCCGDRFGLKPATYRMKREWAKLRYAKAAEVAPQRMD